MTVPCASGQKAARLKRKRRDGSRVSRKELDDGGTAAVVEAEEALAEAAFPLALLPSAEGEAAGVEDNGKRMDRYVSAG